LQDLLALYTKAGVKGIPVVFLITDNQASGRIQNIVKAAQPGASRLLRGGGSRQCRRPAQSVPHAYTNRRNPSSSLRRRPVDLPALRKIDATYAHKHTLYLSCASLCALQIVNERFLVYINDLMATGHVADLCGPEERDAFCNAVSPAGLVAGRGAPWRQYQRRLSIAACATGWRLAA
jgi:hypothetical protein